MTALLALEAAQERGDPLVDITQEMVAVEGSSMGLQAGDSISLTGLAAGMLLATVLEYLTGIAMMRLFGSLWWDYSHKPFNYKGILCLESSVGWGVLAVLYFRVLEGLVSGYIGAIPVALGKFVCVAALIYFPLDFGYHLYRRLRERRGEPPMENADNT